jgi:MoaA/NifB/PqqE/SkfB family radical SAM enzyme/2-polyprenyl-3-methyl-5-hydroxy-6-metoxy-1,4-benzoquinol methylase
MKALIKVGYGCNDHCSFCHTLDVRHVDGEALEIHDKIERAKALGHSMVVLSGGEPTIRPELLAWAEHVARLDMDFGLVTNGRMLSYGDLTKKLLERRLKYVYLSLHGGSAKIHDLMVRSEAFDETYGALENLSGHGLDLTVNCVITKHNVDHLVGVVDAVLKYPDLALNFSMVEPKGGGDALFEHLMPRISYVAEKVREAIHHGDEQVSARGAEGPRFSHGAIPLCLMPGDEQRYSDLKSHRFATMTEIGEPDFYPVDDLNKLQPPQTCRGCSLSGPCPGLYRGYVEAFGHDEVSPVFDRPRSNSFNYVFEAHVPARRDGACPLFVDGTTPWDRGRHLFVEHAGRIGRYVARSRDFSDAEIAELKHELGQIYVDVSRKDAPDDFAKDLVQLERSARCEGCPARDGCTGMFTPRMEDVFTRDDARVRELIATLEGPVLDVGCGEGPYEDVLAPRAEAGAIEYVGVEPDARRARELRARRPWATIEQGRAEELNGSHEGRFSHVLVLRSWNHFEDPDRALERIRSSLAPGGTLTVVDNVAFGLARSARKTRRAEASDAAFEHYRNDGAEEAHRRIASHGLTLLERRDVAPGTSNQWLLRYAMGTD